MGVGHLRHLSTAGSCVPVQSEHQSMTTHAQTRTFSVFLQPAIFSGSLHENRNLWVDFCPTDAVPVNGVCFTSSNQQYQSTEGNFNHGKSSTGISLS